MSDYELRRIADALEKIAKALDKPSPKINPAPYVGDIPPYPGQPYRYVEKPWDQSPHWHQYTINTNTPPKSEPGEEK